jgi:3-methyl-2-oxobutanoate hydroxymethyltransferase
MSSDNTQTPARVTLNTLAAMKQAGEKFTMLTAYDASFAALLDAAGVDVLLVGDTLGMVIQGNDTTLPVTMDDMVYHTRCVSRAARRALVLADMPFMSVASPDIALANAGRLLQEGGAHAVKLEGGAVQAESVYKLAQHGIPVCAHLGLQPQSVYKLGGYRVQGRGEDAARMILADARALQDAGADMLLLECVPAALANEITAAVDIPVVGIGAGAGTDAQVLVLYDMLGITPGRVPRFAKNFMDGEGGVRGAVERYVRAVKDGSFPGPEHTFK